MKTLEFVAVIFLFYAPILITFAAVIFIKYKSFNFLNQMTPIPKFAKVFTFVNYQLLVAIRINSAIKASSHQLHCEILFKTSDKLVTKVSVLLFNNQEELFEAFKKFDVESASITVSKILQATNEDFLNIQS